MKTQSGAFPPMNNAARQNNLKYRLCLSSDRSKAVFDFGKLGGAGVVLLRILENTDGVSLDFIGTGLLHELKVSR
jgi:hypothetical protein